MEGDIKDAREISEDVNITEADSFDMGSVDVEKVEQEKVKNTANLDEAVNMEKSGDEAVESCDNPKDVVDPVRKTKRYLEMRRYNKFCHVWGCKSSRDLEKLKNLKWYRDCRDSAQLAAWMKAVKEANERSGIEWQLPRSTKGFSICSAHFLFGKKGSKHNPKALNYKPTIFPYDPIGNMGRKRRKKLEPQLQTRRLKERNHAD